MTENDINEIANVFLESFNNEGESWTQETALAHVGQNFFGDAHWVAKDDDKVVGFLMGIVLTREHGDELFIDSVAVLSEHRGKEIGKQLWSLAEKFVEENNLHGIRLLANPNFKSFDWYKNMGFKESNWVELEKNSQHSPR